MPIIAHSIDDGEGRTVLARELIALCLSMRHLILQVKLQ